MRRSIKGLLIAFTFWGSLVHSADVVPARQKPIDVVADRLEADETSGKVDFLGHVVATQGDVTLYAHQMTLFLKSKTREIDRIEATGDVRIVQGDRVATGDKGIFYRAENRVVLTGDPRVRQGEDTISGEEIIVFLDAQKSIVRSGNRERVKATFHPKEQQP